MSDVHTGRDLWGKSIKPLCPGHEAIGEVIEVGPKVTKFKVGDIVGYGPMRDACLNCETCDKGATNLCPLTDGTEKFLYGLYFGGYSTHIQQPETCVVKIPEGLDITTAPPILCAGITVWDPIYKFVKPGMRVGVIGVGGLGHLAVQFAAKLGAKVDGFTSSPSKETFIKELGAEGIVLWREKDYSKKIANKYDVLINTIPVKVTKDCFSGYAECIKPLGVYIQVGLPDTNEVFEASYFDFILKNITIYGSLVGSAPSTSQCLEFCAKNNVVCKTEHYSWEQFPEALDKLENGKPIFRCVVNVDDESKKYNK
jgi:uncharacterized zinc-type alcohol dehydrogenase-like protein